MYIDNQLQIWNRDRQIQRLQKKLDDNKRILMLIAKQDIPGLRRLVAVMLKQGQSSIAILNRLTSAIQGKKLARSGFNQRDYDKAFLVKALGGPTLLTALHRAEGYPALSTVQKHRPVARLLPCLGPPSEDDIRNNISALLHPDIREPPKKSKAGKLPGIIIMIDGVALEEVCRYDSFRDSVVGICREHSAKMSFQANNYDALLEIAEALESGKDIN